MVSRKRLDYGFQGYQSPFIPRAPRSIRRRGPPKNSYEDSKLCAFELLAAVAGKLLQESESSASSNVAGGKDKRVISRNGNEMDQLLDDKGLKSDSLEHGSCAESAFVPEISIQEQTLLPGFMEKPQSEFNPSLGCASEPVSSDVLEKIDFGEFKKNENSFRRSACFGESFNFKVESGPNMDLGHGKRQIGGLSLAKKSSVKETDEECVNSNTIINSACCVQLPVYREPTNDACLQKQLTVVKLGVRDDDENSFRCKKLSTMVMPFKPQPRTERRRIRKMITSKYRKVGQKRKDYELYNISEGIKSFYQYRKRIYTREGCQQAPTKKRKLSEHRFSVAYDEDTSNDSIFNMLEKGNRPASGIVKGHSKAVKFSIKSFKVPELYIEVPETATVGSLKRSVMEAVTGILGSGIRVGVLLQGKKVRDDNRTLQQAGISQSNDLDTLGFTLDPCFTHVLSSKAAVKKPENPELPRLPPTPIVDSTTSNASVGPSATHVASKSDDDVDNKGLILPSIESSTDEVMDGAPASVLGPNNALVALSPMNVGPLALVPAKTKPKLSELSQRRTRRPFSVTEVEELVGAVEKLGTGRWRDVKIGAFENADHRTYVDLKDKWKTLVHTASISPHQRRGEPVPQELLNRVLVAHSYWSHRQSKQHGKHPVVGAFEKREPREEIVGA